MKPMRRPDSEIAPFQRKSAAAAAEAAEGEAPARKKRKGKGKRKGKKRGAPPPTGRAAALMSGPFGQAIAAGAGSKK